MLRFSGVVAPDFLNKYGWAPSFYGLEGVSRSDARIVAPLCVLGLYGCNVELMQF